MNRPDGNAGAPDASAGDAHTPEGPDATATPAQLAEQLRSNREYLRHLVSSSPAMIFSCDARPPYQPLFISDNIRTQLGYSPEAFTSDAYFWHGRVHPDDLQPELENLLRIQETGRITCEYRLRHADGSYRWIRGEATLHRDAHDQPAEIAGYWIDITDLKRVESEWKAELSFRRAIEDSIHAGLAAIDNTGAITYVNRACEQLFGYPASELIGLRPPHPMWHPDETTRIQGILAGMYGSGTVPAGGIELRCVRRNGQPFPVLALPAPLTDHTGARVGWVFAVHDLTERKRLEDQLRQAQKMEAVGRLAGGVAHDFNNLLTAVLGYTEMLQEQVPPGDPLRGSIDEIRHAADSATLLTRQLLAFSRRQVLQRDVLDVNNVVGAMVNLLRRTIGEHIALDIALDARDADTLADRGQLEQVLLNLVVNARDAMPDGGTIRVATSTATLEAPVTHQRWTTPAGTYVLLTVADRGEGMTPEVVEHLFEPFFTTKPRGNGTGLGLSTVYGIVMQTGGYVGVETREGRGTTMYVYLPSVHRDAAIDDRRRGSVRAEGP
jgi:two-component system cell cycle sensor histidine kinase/response regulator CckA